MDITHIMIALVGNLEVGSSLRVYKEDYAKDPKFSTVTL